MDASSIRTPSENDRHQPLNPNGMGSPGGTTSTRTTSLNDRLNTNYVDVGGSNSFVASATRVITGFVGNYISPKQLLVVLRVLKAVTFCFLVLNIAAGLMYIAFLEILASSDVRDAVGGRRDLIIRIYGLGLAVMAMFIELDVPAIVKPFYGFKGFIARALLLFFVSAITGSHPISQSQMSQTDEYAYNDDGYATSTTEIPNSAVMFQIVTSFILGVCAVTYFVFGMLCFDRFTSKAFLSTKDPLVTTAIPVPSAVHPTDNDNNYGHSGSLSP